MNDSISKQIRTRFAPSPTGYVHIGSLRTGLFSFLFARHYGGVNVLRIEDTDQNRLVPGALENLVEVMHKLGIDFDEGFYFDPSTGRLAEKGDFGPYLQSKRLDLYAKYAQILIQAGGAYYCFCTSQRLEELRARQQAAKLSPRYDGLCRALGKTEVQAKLEAIKVLGGPRPVVRQAVPSAGVTRYIDQVHGEICVANQDLDDQVLLKSDGFATYNFANVVDDHLMIITHVLRGDEFIASTPKHVLLYRAFGWPEPEFVHLPLILNTDHSKLSKRQGDVAVEDYLAKGYLQEALINFVALLGWNPKSTQEIFSLDELVSQFEIGKLNRAAAVFDLRKLDWMNGEYIKRLPLGELAARLMPFWQHAGWIKLGDDGWQLATDGAAKLSAEFFARVAGLEQGRLKKLADVVQTTDYFFREPEYETVLLIWKKNTALDTARLLTQMADYMAGLPLDVVIQADALLAALQEFIASRSFDIGACLWPMRVALTGHKASPGPAEVAAALALGYGQAKVTGRLQSAAARIEAMV